MLQQLQVHYSHKKPKVTGGCICSLVTTGPAASKEWSLKLDDGRMTTADNGACLYYKLNLTGVNHNAPYRHGGIKLYGKRKLNKPSA